LRGNQQPSDIEDRLLSYLRSELDNPRLTFASPPIPLTGGFDTSLYKFRLRGAREDLSLPLVLRVFTRDPNPNRAKFESIVQNALVGVGYPAPKVLFTHDEGALLGGSFMVMEFLYGHPMTEEPGEVIPRLLAEAHIGLHRIDVGPVKEAIKAAGIEEKYVSFKWRTTWLRNMIETSGHEWLSNGLVWIVENLPPEPERLAVIHGDFHPLNILVDDGEVSGVLDWSGFLLADPAYDVAITMVLGTIAAPSEWLEMVSRYYEFYQQESPIDAERVGYYQAFRCLWALYEGAEGHSGWGRPEVMRRLSGYFEKKTGVLIPLPD
jgi:aminoglycoside phosphotransferase (APT) family kinase protein